jgi:acyl-coenzyme A thioesterase PaaI-like protein
MATVLDEMMVWACAVNTKRFGYCAELSVRYVGPARPGEVLMGTGELVADRRGRVYEAKGELRRLAGGELVASSSGKYLPVKGVKLKDLVGDFVGDASWLLPPED